jgi:acyl transferase domain-containing protein
MQFILPTPPHRDAGELCALAREILGGLLEQDAEALPTDVALRDLGVDSRTTVALIAALSTQLSRSLPTTLVYAHPTLEALGRYLARDCEGDDPDDGIVNMIPTASDLPVDEPIAIIGIGCRFPGGASTPSAFFELLQAGRDAVIEAPETRGELRTLGETAMRGGFLADVASFDEAFFGISPREASAMDPQQRLMLEVAWEALEDAGIAADGLRDSRTGVFVGAMWQDYMHHAAALESGIEQHTATGLDTSVISARISYRLGLCGPSLTVNTACSSSLVAVHLACQSLRQRESSLALAGGVSLILSPHSTTAMARFGALSPDARCKAFDASANGYVRGEGAGVVVLKRLSEAVAAGDPIYCVIRGSAVNNDGASNGLAAPSVSAQAQVLRDAYARARVDPSKVHYVEAHGTGTRLGDPIEAQALGQVLGRGRSSERALRIGSVKTNLGHLEAAAGVASLIKVALAMRHGALPPTLHLQTPNPAIDFERLSLAVQRDKSAWPRPDEIPLAGVSAFGFGGTNAHVVLEGAHQSHHELLIVAADDRETLEARVERLSAAADQIESGEGLRALCAASARHWSEGRLRKALVLRSASELNEQLERAPFEPDPGAQVRRVVFVYSGVGSQWPGMARGLLATEPVFRAALDRCDRELEPITGHSVRADLWAADPQVLARCDRYQPMIFAIQVALAALLESYGIVPDAVVGHSIGEVAAAHRAGILDLPDACAVICHMARLLGRAEGGGGLLLLGQSASAARALIAELDDEEDFAVVAAENGPRSTVISGTRAALSRAAALAHDRGIFSMPVPSEIAFHHPMLRHALAPLPSALATIKPARAKIAMWSTTDGAWLDGRECHGRYFQRNQLQCVRFADAVTVLADESRCSFVELGPHPLLVRELREMIARRDPAPVIVPAMTRTDQLRPSVLDCVATLYRAGHSLRYRLSGGARPLAEAELMLPTAARRFMPLSRGAASAPDAAPFTLPLAAHSERALRRSAELLGDHLASLGEAELPHVIYKLARVRSALPHRAAVTATSASDLRQALVALARGDHARGLVCPEPGAPGGRRSKAGLSFVFSGHGSQWAGMGAELLASEPVFAAAIDACDEAFLAHGGERVRPQLEAGPSGVFPKRADRVQPLLFAMQVALARVWLSWGVTPDLVIGHSVGEIAAAHVAGLIDLSSAVRVVLERAEALEPAIGRGAMALVELPPAEAEALVAGYGGRIAVAVHHSPSCCVLAGDHDALAGALRVLDARQVFCRWVDVDYASHSPQMRPIAERLRERLSRVSFAAPASAARFPMYSTTLGRILKRGECDAAYWAQNLAQPVLFRQAIEHAALSGIATYLEVSPHPLLSNGILETARKATGSNVPALFVPTLRRSSPERYLMQEALGQLYVGGRTIDWLRQHALGNVAVALPPYPFERRRHWKSQRALITTLPEPAPTTLEDATVCDAGVAHASLRAQLSSSRGAARLELLRSVVRAELARLTRNAEARIEGEARLSDLGIDSLMGLSLRSRLETQTGIALSSTRMWEKPTLEGLAEQLASEA